MRPAADRATAAALVSLALGAAAPLPVAGAAQAAPDGAALFRTRCASCHEVGESTSTAPALGGVAGRPIASLQDFDYSPGLKAHAGRWTDESLDAYLAAPDRFAPGTSMLMTGLAPAERQAIVAYLKSLGGGR